MTNPDQQLPKVINLLRSIAWSFWRKTGVDFDELMSESYLVFMKCCESYRKDKGTKFSSWLQFKVSMHLRTYLHKKFKDRLVFVDEIVDEMLPIPEAPSTFRNSLADQIKGLSPEAQELIQLLVNAPESAERSPAKLLRASCAELAYEGIDPVFQKIIVHEIKSGIGQ
jgi:DNA-directed RNA polymerase sigma subunit (sigma70/sigma32)